MKVYKNDIGTKITLDAECDISTATVWKIIYSKPGKPRVKGEWVAAPEGTTSAYYIIIAGDLDVSGTWELQLYIESVSWKGHGEKINFEVHETLT